MHNTYPLANQIRDLLQSKGIETPTFRNDRHANPAMIKEAIEDCFGNIMQCLSLDLQDDSLRDTPKRVAKMYCEEIFQGLSYGNFPKITTIENRMNYDEMLTTRCQVKSMCEHHFVPFIGQCIIGYIPKTKILGLSKFNRVTEFFCRRPQVQERLTAQIHAALSLILETEDVAVVIRATHYCVHLRGVQDTTSSTTTSELTGKFRNNAEARAEFLALTRN